MPHHSPMNSRPEPRPVAPVPDWEALRMFLCVVDQGSLSKASAALDLSQPTLTRQITALEASLGLVLFERTARGMALTEVAEALVVPVRAMFAQSLAVARIAQGLDSTLQGVVRISASELVAAYRLPAMLAQLRRESPEIDIVLLATDSVSNLVEREADIAVRMVRPTQAGLIARKVAELPVGIFAHDDYLARRGEPRTIAALLDHDLIGFEQEDGLREGLVRIGLDAGRLRFGLTSNSRVVVWNLIRAGLGIGFITTEVAVRDPAVRQILRDAPTPRLPIWMTVHQEVRANRRLRRVYDFLAERFASNG